MNKKEQKISCLTKLDIILHKFDAILSECGQICSELLPV